MQRPWLVQTGVDEKLRSKTGLTAFDLARVRRLLWTDWRGTCQAARDKLMQGGTVPRFSYLNSLLSVTLDRPAWLRWLKFVDHSDQDIEEMHRGEYPISPWLVRCYSALFGIKADFLLLGTAPVVDKVGANVDVWPMTATGAR